MSHYTLSYSWPLFKFGIHNLTYLTMSFGGVGTWRSTSGFPFPTHYKIWYWRKIKIQFKSTRFTTSLISLMVFASRLWTLAYQWIAMNLNNQNVFNRLYLERRVLNDSDPDPSKPIHGSIKQWICSNDISTESLCGCFIFQLRLVLF